MRTMTRMVIRKKVKETNNISITSTYLVPVALPEVIGHGTGSGTCPLAH